MAMSSNSLRIITSNAGDSATLTASPSVVSTLPATYLQLNSRTKAAQTTSTADQDINGNWNGATHAISACAITRHNLSASGTWRLRLYDGQNQSGNVVYDSGAMQANPPKTLGDLNWGVDPLGATPFTDWDSNGIFSTVWFTLVNALSYKITLSDSTNADGYIRVGRLYIGNYITTQFSVSYGIKLEWIDDSEQFRTDGGTLRTDAKTIYRELSFSLSHIQPSERPNWLAAARAIGKSRDVFLSIFPEDGTTKERDYSMPCKLTNGGGQSHDSPGNWSTDFTFQEV